MLDYQVYENLRTYKGEMQLGNPNKYTIVIDLETGEELWKHCFEYSKIDKTYGVVLAGNEEVLEIDIRTGKIITQVQPNPILEHGCFPHFVDDKGIYYTLSGGSFGKINKKDGTIEWEFDLLDEQGAKRMLSEWLVLENEKLVLQAMPNHLNGDLTCIFNPLENLESSNVKGRKRVSHLE